jgi:hypothetical protein
LAATPVRAEYTTSSGAKAKQKCDQGSEGQPRRIAVLGGPSILAEFVPRNAEQRNIKNERNEGDQRG